ncbi:hypothetical protein A2767_07115 [Candidatus Roizmanbacteria bacterium RIFCSPHIGHO2_01_FULL_35_10]|uniref:Uncharacterized protein n=1 Tax=Candidatus Roizmanbacteria bacterium RIFCSPLOWO2_01_FULL_35_13 TaxID=1802055 RepID=A0A1F7ID93_9BACT|nr:MAG: hypothetical protein A2767_07115 [Candidatus Roizmanbacteria bacterium RIFCSPHIGHO2_01_FULL_35_10]OGK41325.1 MAG: hypothetical protein A3A74_03255 [Candidatus Roizmanbacteria bacterium RIFCSPLOWO2_01_FULL_35_13]
MSETGRSILFNIFNYCPALIAMWEKTYLDEQGYRKSPNQIKEIDYQVEVEYNPLTPGQAFTNCEAPVKEKGAKLPGAPYIQFIESTGEKDRIKIRCHGCILLQGGFSTITSI